jgi:hypothetical protein
MPIILKNGSEARIPEDIPRVRAEFRIPGGECLGCWLGDAAPEMHDIPDACEYLGGFAVDLDDDEGAV